MPLSYILCELAFYFFVSCFEHLYCGREVHGLDGLSNWDGLETTISCSGNQRVCNLTSASKEKVVHRALRKTHQGRVMTDE